MKNIGSILTGLGLLLLLYGSAGATTLTHDFTLSGSETFRGRSLSVDLGAGLSVTVTATWVSSSLGASGDGDLYQNLNGIGVLHTYTNNDDNNIDGRGPDETLWLTFSDEVTLTHLSFLYAYPTDQFDFFVGDQLVLNNQETSPSGEWRPLGANGYG
ncbi:MAG: hypothetical protein MI747_08950, partial [Desulfobacterales bacterium]|nr:hypothetical protein [Desulfobacterales bacterium]